MSNKGGGGVEENEAELGEKVAWVRERIGRLKEAVGTVIVGLDEVVDGAVWCRDELLVWCIGDGTFCGDVMVDYGVFVVWWCWYCVWLRW